jgi:serine phosphatase RsbU (regulator of sigma subunit)
VTSASGPADALRRLNRTCGQQLPGCLATVLYAELDTRTGRLILANAGHMPPLLVAGQGAAYLDAGDNPPLGVADDVVFAEHEHFLSRGWCLVLFTDGLVERRHESIDEGLEQLRAGCVDRATRDVDDLCSHIVASMVGDDVDDDVALLAVCPVAPVVDLATKPARSVRSD